MANRNVQAIILMIIVGFSLLISIPIIILSVGFSPYITIEKSLTYFYTPINSSAIEEINLNSDVGNIEIGYTYEQVDYAAKIEVKVEMVGQNLPGNSYSEYFHVIWENEST